MTVGAIHASLLSKDSTAGVTFTITPRYHAVATSAAVDAKGITTIYISGSAYVPDVSSDGVHIYRTSGTNPFKGVFIISVKLDPTDGNQHNNNAAGQTKAGCSFFAAVNDGGSGAGGSPKLYGDFFAYEQALRNGIYVSAGDVNGDGHADLIAGDGAHGRPVRQPRHT